ncbi:Bifunctional protein GlmU [Rosistilla carotiformis]|uniref:Bifunctional protein GlmU n=1 Tax=Rosistilla carotiformis TaxID=2528017 RepID=A0A518JZV0_9BACT|nr:putative sugar nucleotidyl transferase [Rosistilla carotiformis]QDV71070.1 Bifunctional protein GlmU [Rosistilla carotiformis]
MRILIFEDSSTDQLAPITTSRPAYAITCASYRLIDWVRRLNLPTAAEVRSYLRPIQQADFADLQDVDSWQPTDQPVLAINARCVPSIENFQTLQRLVARKASGTVKSGHDVAAILLMPQDLERCKIGPGAGLAAPMLAAEGIDPIDESLPMFHWPHEVIRWHMQLMNASLEDRIANGNYEQREDGVFLAPGAKIGDYAVIDTSQGPILLDENVQVGPFCYFSGPVYAGAGTRVIEHAALKDGVSLGHTVKIGGEVEASVIEPYTNKQHHGFLGHSYLGSWINLGAGTCNSDLKNTYGRINIEYGDRKMATEMQFLGCIVGDYSKSAINTGIFTGKVIGVCSMLYGFVTQNVPSFMNYAQIFGQVAEIPADVMVATQARMFARRKVQQRQCDIDLIRAMYDQTSDQREEVDHAEIF